MATKWQQDVPGRHPRRKPAHESVSLRRLPQHVNSPWRRDHISGGTQSSSEHSSLLKTKVSSGETSNADHWFDSRNKGVAKQHTPFVDNDPPFYLDTSSGQNSYYPVISPLRPTLAQVGTNGSGSDDYRSVIDDLTIENKKLKRRLKKYENSRKSQLDGDKLFEVKIHGLPADKKQELEETLRKFAQGLNRSPARGLNGTSSDLSYGRTSALPKENSVLSSVRVADSGYGSMTASGKASVAHSGTNGTHKDRVEASQNRDKSIQSYLSDIPVGLMPRQPTAMTEKTKKKLVVRRLEAIFSGRGAAPGMHQQHLQQQEVSQSAAQADKSALEAQGQKVVGEGVREAKIMATETVDPMDFAQDPEKDVERSSSMVLQEEENIQEQDFGVSEPSALEQRPTRPLDLDPYRAQIPTENINYIRHLGFWIPEAGKRKNIADDEGWIYLNLLTNMAQLHTLNVTPNFVQKSVSDYSSKLELSKDARKVRWRDRGSSHGSSIQSDSSSSSKGSPNALQNYTSNGSRKRLREAICNTNDLVRTREPSSKRVILSHDYNDRFTYRPLFPPKVEYDSDSEASIMSSGSSMASLEEAGESSGLTSTVKLGRSTPMSKRRDDGPIIFYNQATFCTDLSGDTLTLHRPSKLDYCLITSCPLGTSPKPLPSASDSVRASQRPLLATSAIDDEGADNLSISTDTGLDFPRASPKHVSFAEPEQPLAFIASGVGGVYPEDNLAINVLRQHFVDHTARPPRPIVSSKLQNIIPVMQASNTRRPRETILSAREITLHPSALPAPSYAFIGDDEFEEGGDNDSDISSTASDHDYCTSQRCTLPPPPHPQYHTLSDSFISSSGMSSSANAFSDRNNSSLQIENGVDDDDDDDDDESSGIEDGTVDFLASARAIDPETIRVKEREYDAEIADRLAEEIPAGSSAATAGGGSGFNSPVEWREDEGESGEREWEGEREQNGESDVDVEMGHERSISS